MPSQNISDFTSFINTQTKAHSDLTDHLAHIEELFNFLLASDFTEVTPSALQAQLMSMDKLVQEAKTMSEALHANLVNSGLSLTADSEQQS